MTFSSSIESKKSEPSGSFAFGAGIVLLALSPIIRGGNRYIALIGIEWLGLLALWLMSLCWLMGRKSPNFPLRRSEWVLVLSPLWAALLFLMPVPVSIWSAIPGHGIYRHLSGSGWQPLSLTPDATLASLLAGIPLVAAFMLARTASDRQLSLLPPALVLIAFGQAIWGLLQAGLFKELYFGAEFAGGLIGSFANANHFSSFIAMTLPLAVFLLWKAFPGKLPGRSQRQQLATGLWSLVLLVLITAVLASGSRTGMATGMMVMLLTVLLLLGSVSEGSRRWYVLGTALLLAVVVVIVGANTLATRFDAARLGGDVSFRWTLIGSSWQAAQAFWPLGSGPGSYSAVFPLFQPPGLRGFAEYAHNDYVQLLMEMGALFVLLAGLLAWLVARQATILLRQARKAAHGLGSAQLQLCCGLGLLAVLLHSLVDFNLRIPANAMLAACLLGAFLRPRHPPGRDSTTSKNGAMPC